MILSFSLQIVDRKKDLVKLQYGEYVSLGKVEAELKTSTLVDNVCVYADPTKLFAVCLLVPNPDHLNAMAEKSKVTNLLQYDHKLTADTLDGVSSDDLETLCSNAQMEKLYLGEMQKHGARCRLQKFEIPQRLKLISDVWMPDTGLVTAAFKLKRKNIQDRYQHLIDQMYSS